MSSQIYIVSSLFVFMFSGLMAMAGLGAAIVFVPFFFYMGVPLEQTIPTGLLLNAVSLSTASINYVRGKLVDWRTGVPLLIAATASSPLGARMVPYVDINLLLSLFAAFLVFAGAIMLFYQSTSRQTPRGSGVVVATGLGVGSVAGLLGGLLGVGGGNIIVPALNWLGLETKVAVGTCALVVVFSSLSGFLGHVSMGGLDPAFVGVMVLMAASGSAAGSYLMMSKVSSAHLKRLIGGVLWLIAAKMIFDMWH